MPNPIRSAVRSAPQRALDASRARLLSRWTPRGAFVGELSTSALSTSVAAMALTLGARAAAAGEHKSRWQGLADRAHRWLVEHQNEDGGYGDTIESPSNISTTTLAWVSLGLTDHGDAEERAQQWLQRDAGALDPAHLAQTLRDRYGKDQTFSVPILTTCALGGRLGEGRDAWRHVPPLPFELAACPHRLFKWLNLRVVSYALPALIAIGQVRHHFRPTANPLARPGRALTRRRTLRLLREIQPGSGGYLEAAPLTSFVCMSLIAMGLVDHPVVQNGLRFLAETVRDDGSWPIDTNLDTWGTTLSVLALAAGPPAAGASESSGAERIPQHQRAGTTAWLLDQQYTREHPFTRAAPGGWAWTDLSGGVPDADDTPGALLALHTLRATGPESDRARIGTAAQAGIRWLLDLQNRDGGMPTFCRGWGKLPFDMSSPDLTAHALRAYAAWHDELPTELCDKVDRARRRAVAYLVRTQRDDGAWIPLWFGSQREANQENPLYGTARVVRALTDAGEASAKDSAARGVAFLLRCQDLDSGGFGAAPGVAPSIEESALATDALARWAMAAPRDLPADDERRAAQCRATRRGAEYLASATNDGTSFPTTPIGLYFARLWYWEQLYPLVFTVEALASAAMLQQSQPAAGVSQ